MSNAKLGPLKNSNFHSNDSAVLQQRLAELEAELTGLDLEYERLQVENEELKEQHEEIKSKNKLLFEQLTSGGGANPSTDGPSGLNDHYSQDDPSAAAGANIGEIHSLY